MKKISYRNKPLERAIPVSGEIPSNPVAGGGYSANFGGNESGGARGFSLPGEKAIPMEEADELVYLKNNKNNKPKPDYHDDLLDKLISLADTMDIQGEYSLASFADFIITKIAQQNNADYEALLKDLVLKISNSDITAKNNLIISVGKIYNDKYLNLLSEYGEEVAHREAYQDAYSVARKELEG